MAWELGEMQMNTTRSWRISTNGVSAIALAAILFGAAGAFAKLLFTIQVSPVDLTAIRTIIALIAFAMFLAVTSRS